MTVMQEIDNLISSCPTRVRALMLSPRYWNALCKAVGADPGRAWLRYGHEPLVAGVLILPSWDA